MKKMKNKNMSNAKKIALIVALIIIIAVIVVIVIRVTKKKDEDGGSKGGGTADQYKELTLTYYDTLTCTPGTNSSAQPSDGNIVDGDLVTLKVPSVLPEGIIMRATQDTDGDPVITVTYAKGEYTFLDETLTIENKKNALTEVLFPILDENQMSNPGKSRLYTIGAIDDVSTFFQVKAYDTNSTNVNTWERKNPFDPTKRTPFVPTLVFAGFIVNGDGSANTYDQNNVCELGQASREKDGKNYITPNSTFPPFSTF